MTRQHWPKWVLAMIYVAMCTQGSMTICQENPVPPPLNVAGEIILARVEAFAFGHWSNQEHGGSVFYGQRCRVWAVAEGDNNENVSVRFGLRVHLEVAADERGEVETKRGIRKVYAKSAPRSVDNSSNERIAEPMQQNVEVQLLAEDVFVPEWIVVPPPPVDFSLRDSREPIGRWVRSSAGKRKRWSFAATSQPQSMAHPERINDWQVEVLNVYYVFTAVDVPTESLTRVLDVRFDQIMVGLMVE